MQNFELVFLTNFHGDPIKGHGKYDGTFKRVIVAKNLDDAKMIGNAMLNEEVYLYEYLEKLVSVELTKNSPGIFVFGDGAYTWQRVL